MIRNAPPLPPLDRNGSRDVLHHVEAGAHVAPIGLHQERLVGCHHVERGAIQLLGPRPRIGGVEGGVVGGRLGESGVDAGIVIVHVARSAGQNLLGRSHYPIEYGLQFAGAELRMTDDVMGRHDARNLFVIRVEQIGFSDLAIGDGGFEQGRDFLGHLDAFADERRVHGFDSGFGGKADHLFAH